MCSILEQHGWVLDRTWGSHHVDQHAGIPFSIHVPVHSHRDLKPGTQRLVMRQAGVTDADP
jgi:predicted RNA binding protein YcfA (HicA-like mRNA interferase family)